MPYQAVFLRHILDHAPARVQISTLTALNWIDINSAFYLAKVHKERVLGYVCLLDWINIDTVGSNLGVTKVESSSGSSVAVRRMLPLYAHNYPCCGLTTPHAHT